MLHAGNITQIYILGDLELILKKRDAADHQFFRLEDGNLVVKERFLNSSHIFINNSKCFLNLFKGKCYFGERCTWELSKSPRKIWR